MASRPDFADALAVFLDNEVELIVVGGVAAVLGGAPVNTLDLDLLIEASSANIARVVAALRAVEALYRDPAGRRIEPSIERFSAHGQHRFTTRYGEIDVLASIGRRRSYDDLRPRSRAVPLRGREVRVLDLEAVIQTKEEAGRPRDHLVLPVLRETLRLREES